MTARTFVWLALAVFFVGIVASFVYSDPFWRDDDHSDTIVGLIRNVSWDTEYRERVPYQRGNEIEYSYIVRGMSGAARVWFDEVSARAIIEEMRIDGNTVTPGTELSLAEISTITIRATANADESADADISDFLTIERIPQTSTTDRDTRAHSDETGEENTRNDPVEEDAEWIPDTGIDTTLPADPDISLLYNDIVQQDVLTLSPSHNTLLTLSWSDVMRMHALIVGDRSIPIIRSDDALLAAIPERQFSPGEYFVAAEGVWWSIRPLDIMIRFREEASDSITIADITPRSLTLNDDQIANLVIQGRGFSRAISVQLNNTYILKNTDFRVINDRVLVVVVPPGLDSGEYFFNIMTPEHISSHPEKTFSLIHSP